MTTAPAIGKWLHETIRDNAPRRSYQSVMVRRIREDFGEEFSYRNHNGNWAIDKTVLKEFNKLRDEHIVWDKSDQSWRVVDDDQLAVLRERAERLAAARAERAERKRAHDEERARNTAG